MAVPALLRWTDEILKTTVGHLGSLNAEEKALLIDSLATLQAPINRTKGHRAGRDTACRCFSPNRERMAGHYRVRSTVCGRFRGRLEPCRSGGCHIRNILEGIGRSVVRAIEIDKFLDMGPRLEDLSWFCDLRSMFVRLEEDETPPAGGGTQEVKIPLAIFRLRIDEHPWPFYFQMTGTEIDGLISRLERARKQLQSISDKEGL